MFSPNGYWDEEKHEQVLDVLLLHYRCIHPMLCAFNVSFFPAPDIIIIIFICIAPFIQQVQSKVLHIDITQKMYITQNTDTSKRHKNKQKIALSRHIYKIQLD